MIRFRSLRLLMALMITMVFFVPPKPNAQEVAEGPLSEANAQCASIDHGTMNVEEGAIIVADITGDGEIDQLLDYRKMSCTTAQDLWCGADGCELTIFAAGTKTELRAHRWTVVQWGAHPIVLLSVDAGACGGTASGACYQALVWADGGFRGVGSLN